MLQMKKLRVLSVVLLCSFMMCSCMTFRNTFTTPTYKGEYTAAEANAALHKTIERAVDSTNTRFFQRLSNYDFIPHYYTAIAEKQTNIPGMKKLIELWNNNVGEVLLQNSETITTAVLSYAKDLIFEDAKTMVQESDTSASILLVNTYFEDLRVLLNKVFDGLDESKLENIVKQYNAWIGSQNYVNKSNLPTLEIVDCKESIVDMAIEYYTETLMMYEELYRTTPDPYTEEVCQKVFGIK